MQEVARFQRSIAFPVKPGNRSNRRMTCTRVLTPPRYGTRLQRPVPDPFVYRDWAASDWSSAFQNCHEPVNGSWLRAEYGCIPIDLNGTYFRNGPGLFNVGSQGVAHPFDGDGVVCSLKFCKGQAFFHSQKVQTREGQVESQLHKRVFRGTFGTRPGDSWQENFLNVWVKNVANTSVIRWAGQLWALYEAAQPYRLDPTSLKTVGHGVPALFSPGLPFDTGFSLVDAAIGWLLRTLHPVTFTGYSGPVLGGDAVSAHPKVDPLKQRLVTFKYRLRLGLGPRGLQLRTLVTLLELDASGAQVSQREYELDGYAFLHDFVITQNYYVIYQNPVTFDILPFIVGKRSPIHSVNWVEGQATRIHVIPRQAPQGGTAHSSTSQDVKVIDAPSSFVFHHANGFESRDGRSITVDSIHYTKMPDFNLFCGEGRDWRDVDPDTQPPSRLVRQVIDLSAGTVETTPLSCRVMEFPAVPPHLLGSRIRYIYTAAARHPILNRPQQAIAKVDAETGEVDTWTRGHRYYVGEPVFVPRGTDLPGVGPAAPAVTAAPTDSRGSAAGAVVKGVPASGPYSSASPGTAAEAFGRDAQHAGSRGSEGDEGVAEDHGWLVAMCYDAALQRTEVVVLDAEDVGAGPVAALPLPYAVPHGLHGSWAPDEALHA